MAFTPVPSTTRRVHVYELLNHARKESLLVVTDKDEPAVLSTLKREPPSEAGFWKAGDDIAVEMLGQHMTEHSAEEFLRGYLEHMQNRTWRFRIWRP